MVRQRKPFVEAEPMTPASCDVRNVAAKLTAHLDQVSEETSLMRFQAAFPVPDEKTV